MGRTKIVIRKLEKSNSRNVTYSKRRNGLIKKAFEISVLCNTKVALIAFSPGKQLSHFSRPERLEDILIEFLRKLDEDQKDKNDKNSDQEETRRRLIAIRESVIAQLKNIKTQDDMAAAQKYLANGEGSSKPRTSEIYMQTQSEEQLIDKFANLGIVDSLREIKRLFSCVDHQQSLSSQHLNLCETRIASILNMVTQRKDDVSLFGEMHINAVSEHMDIDMLQWQAPLQQRQQQQYFQLLPQQHPCQHQLPASFVPRNMNSLNHIEHLYGQHGSTFYQNGNMNIVTGAQNHSMVMQQLPESFNMLHNQKQILPGGSMQEQFQMTRINPPMQTYHNERGSFNDPALHEINQHPIQPLATSSGVAGSDVPLMYSPRSFGFYAFDSLHHLPDEPSPDGVEGVPIFDNNLGQSNKQHDH